MVSPEKQQTIKTVRDWVNRQRQQIAQKDKPPTTAPALPVPGVPGVPASLDEAVVDLDDTSRERRLAALRFINLLAVDDSKRDQVLSGCSIALTDKDHQVRALAVTVTRKWSSDKGYTEFVAAIEQTGPGPVFDDMCQRLLDLGTPRAIEYVASHLSHSIVVSLMRSAGSKVEAAVVKQLTSVDVIVRRNAAKVLETIATEVSFDALKNALDDKDRTVAALAAQAIERLVPSKPKPPSITELVEQLKSGDTTTHEAALQKLAAINDPERKADVAPVLGKFLRHEELNLRRLALTAAQNWATKDHIGLLTPYVAKQDGDANDRHTAMKALAQTRHTAAVRPIVRWLIQDSDFVKETLIEMGSVAEREVIRVATTANSTKAKIAACEILESIGTKRVEAPLRLLLKHRNPEVQSAAAKARQAIASRK